MDRMFLYLLTLTEETEGRIPAYGDWYEQKLVRAKSSVAARALAAQDTADEERLTGSNPWSDSRASNCRKLGEATPGTRQNAEVIIQHGRFH